MKKYSILITVTVLAAALLTGCRRPAAMPTELPATQGATLMPTTVPTTMPTTVPTTVPPADTEGTATDGSETETGAISGETDNAAKSRSNMK